MLKKRWYFRAALWLMLVLVLFPLPLALWLDTTTPRVNIVFLNAIITVMFIGQAISLISIAWLCPYYASDDDVLEFKHTPRRTIKDLNVTTWGAPIVACVLGTLLITAPILFDGLSTLDKDLTLQGAIVLTAGLVMAAPSFWVSKRIAPRMIAMTRRRLICFECGYDLRNIEHATTCPECGVAVPWIKQEESLATDPRQGPAGHDRA